MYPVKRSFPISTPIIQAKALQISQRKVRLAAWAWVTDALGAILFAACLAMVLGQWAEGGDFADSGLLLVALVAGGLVRASAQGLAATTGQAAAKTGFRRRQEGRDLVKHFQSSDRSTAESNDRMKKFRVWMKKKL